MPTFLEQAIEAQRTKVSELEQRQVQLDAVSNEAGKNFRAAKRALAAAQANPNTSPEELARLQAEVNRLDQEYASASDAAGSNLTLLNQTKEALNDNLLKLNDPKWNTPSATPGGNTNPQGTTTANVPPGTDPEVDKNNKTQTNRETGVIPPDEPAYSESPGVVELNGTGYVIPPDPETDNGLTEPPDPGPEELNGYGYDLGNEIQYEGLVGPPPVDNTDGYGDYPKGEPVYAEDGTFSGYYKNPETGDLYDPNGSVQNSTPDSSPQGTGTGLVDNRNAAQSSPTAEEQTGANNNADWRVRLSLAPEADYLYNDPETGILAPLRATDGILFPYTPSVTVNYTANYDPASPVHTNYKIYQYTSSGVDSVSITCDFTAQDTFEANYLLAVIHFLRSVTKMWYGQDQKPKLGTPPPLCYLTGLGAFQFNQHPLVITSFNYQLPTDVDYIRAKLTNRSTSVQSIQGGKGRLGSQILPGGGVPRTIFTNTPEQEIEPTYVPTKMNIQISALPIVSRNQISNLFSLKGYGTGELTNRGIW